MKAIGFVMMLFGSFIPMLLVAQWEDWGAGRDWWAVGVIMAIGLLGLCLYLERLKNQVIEEIGRRGPESPEARTDAP